MAQIKFQGVGGWHHLRRIVKRANKHLLLSK